MLNSTENSLVRLILEGFPLAGVPVAARLQVAPEEWQAIADSAAKHRVTPLLYASLLKSERLAEVPVPVREQLWKAHLHSGVTSLLAYQELTRLLERFQQKHIPVIVLKGAALATQFYPSPGLRPFGDIDLLIPKAILSRADQLLEEEGYAPAIELGEGFSSRYLAQQAYTRSGSPAFTFDLHWHFLAAVYYRRHIPIDWFWQHTTEVHLGDCSARVFTPGAQLLHLCAHYALHHRDGELLTLYDVARLLSQPGVEFDWPELMAQARMFHLSRAVQFTCEQVRESWGVSLPTQVWEELDQVQPGLEERIAFAVSAGRHSHWRTFLDGLNMPGLGAKLAYAWQYLFPTQRYMRQHYRLETTRLPPLHYVRRILQSLWRFSCGLVSTHKA